MGSDFKIRRVRALGGRAREEAAKLKLKEMDLVLVETTITMEHPLPEYKLKLIEGCPVEWLQNELLYHKDIKEDVERGMKYAKDK